MNIKEKIIDTIEYFRLLNSYKKYIYNPWDKKPVDPSECKLNIYFGLPGAGKSTYASYLAYHDMKHGKAVYSNFPITGAFELNPSTDLGNVDVTNGRVIIDEAGIEFNSRAYKSLSQNIIKFLKLHRHYETIVDVFSQSPDDMDITIRRLAYNCYWIKKSIYLPNFIYLVPLERTLDVIDGDIKTTYIIHDRLFDRKYVYCPKYWRMFNTLSRPNLPKKDWNVY